MGERGPRVVVPDLLGLPLARAHDVALDERLLAVEQNPGEVVAAAVVVAQRPASGSLAAEGDEIRIWVAPGPDEGGGGSVPVPSDPTPLVGAKTIG